MKKTLLWLALLLGYGQSLAQGPYIIYYAVDHMKMQGYVDQPFTGAKSFELLYQDSTGASQQSFCYNWGCMKTYLSNSDKRYTRVDDGYFYEYNPSSKISIPTVNKAQGVYIHKSSNRILDLQVKSYAEGSLLCSESNPLVFKSDLPQYINLEYQSFCDQNVGVMAFKGRFKGTMAMVEEANTYPYIPSTELDPLHIHTASVTIKAPDFMTKYFKPEEIVWYKGRQSLDITGYDIVVGTYGTKGDRVQIEQECGMNTYVAVVKKFNWYSNPININFAPHLMLGRDIILQQPLCTKAQANNDPAKYDASVSLGNSSIHRIFNVAYLDSNGVLIDDKTLDSTTNHVTLPVDLKKYNLTVKEYLGPNPAGGDIFSCEQRFDSITIVAPPSIRLLERHFANIRCFGEKPSLSLRVVGASNRYTLSYEDSTHRLDKGLLYNISLKKGSHTYHFKVNDANGCIYDSALSFKAINPTQLQAVLYVREAPCHDSTALVRMTAKGGRPYTKGAPYRYVFEASSQMQEKDSMVLEAGTHLSPKIYDSQGCFFSLKDTVLRNPADFRVGVTLHTDNKCAHGREGSITLQGMSTDANYVYRYSQDGKSFTYTSHFDKLPTDVYTLYTQNHMGCLKDTTVFITQPPAIQIIKTMQTDVRCTGEQNGSLVLEVNGGTGFKKTCMGYEGYKPAHKAYSYNKEFKDLMAGAYYFYAMDSLGCIDSIQHTIGTQSQLNHVAKLIHPTCAESSNGEILVEALGGVPPYQSEWLSHTGLDKKLVLNNLERGTYILKTVDGLSCSKQDTFRLIAADALPIHLEGYPILCKGQNLELDAGPLGITYEWSSPKSFKANTRKVTLTDTDVYIVKVVDGFGCVGKDTFALQQSGVALKADFLVASTVVQGDTVVLVNNNAYIDSLVWQLDPEHTLNVTSWKDARSKRVVFKELGTQQVQMIAYYKGCRDLLQKNILVVDAKERDQYDSAIGIKNSVFKRCELFPNPNDGKFELHITLKEQETPIALVLSSMTTGSILKQLDPKIYPERKISFEEELPEGPYVLHVKVRDEVVALRFLISID